eukprot:Clim_evm2s185 gene=Clim_evmTU2s185
MVRKQRWVPLQPLNVVVQYGNKGNADLENVALRCRWPSELGASGQYWAYPFERVASGGNSRLEHLDPGMFGRNVSESALDSIIPGQNYNFCFQIKVPSTLDAAAPGGGSNGEVEHLRRNAVSAEGSISDEEPWAVPEEPVVAPTFDLNCAILNAKSKGTRGVVLDSASVRVELDGATDLVAWAEL